MTWGEWHWHCDIALGYYCPSDYMSGGGASASRLWWLRVTEITESEIVDKWGTTLMGALRLELRSPDSHFADLPINWREALLCACHTYPYNLMLNKSEPGHYNAVVTLPMHRVFTDAALELRLQDFSPGWTMYHLWSLGKITTSLVFLFSSSEKWELRLPTFQCLCKDQVRYCNSCM